LWFYHGYSLMGYKYEMCIKIIVFDFNNSFIFKNLKIHNSSCQF
jgi:hypothetical protein